MSDEAGVSVIGLRKAFRDTVAVDGVTLTVRRGEFATLLGPSGCGKTTTLRCIAGLESPDAGEIALAGRVVASPASGVSVPTRERRLGMVFQSFAVWPHMTVTRNVAYPLVIQKLPRAAVAQRVRETLELVGLGALAARYPAQLSGGQQQRVALARALVGEPDVILYDEPLSNLDARLREELRFELRALHDRLGTTSVYVTHDQQEAMALSDVVHVMKDGVIVQSGTPYEVYERPTSAFVCGFLGMANTLPVANVVRRNGHVVEAHFAAGGVLRSVEMNRDAAPTNLSIRPHRIRIAAEAAGDRLGAAENLLRAEVVHAVNLGDRWRYTTTVAELGELVVEENGGRPSVERGSTAVLAIDSEDCLLL